MVGQLYFLMVHKFPYNKHTFFVGFFFFNESRLFLGIWDLKVPTCC